MQSGAMRDEIVEALRAAFPDAGDMERVVGLADIGTLFSDYRVGLGTTYPQALYALISNYADPQDKLLPLLKVARKKNPANPKLGEVMEKLADLEDRFASLRPDRSFGEAERIVLKGVTFEDVGVWIEKLKAMRRAVCRVEPQPPAETIEGFGSGFLVAPDVVITNFHVARPFWGDVARARRVVLQFDYETDPAGVKVSGGVEYRLATAWRGPGTPEAQQAERPWQVLSSPEDKLDYALLRLDKPAGTERIDGAERGFLTPTSRQFSEQDPLLILQHPSAAPLKLAIGAVERPDPPSHVFYKVNTEGGSSGSPCLNQRLETVALHHQGEFSRNRGVTFKAIREDWSTRLDALATQGLSWLANQAGHLPGTSSPPPAKESIKAHQPPTPRPVLGLIQILPSRPRPPVVGDPSRQFGGGGPPVADRGTETLREDTYLAPFLCDRNEQEVQLRRALASALAGRAGRPFVSIVHGSQDQCLDKFLERLTRILLPSLLGRVQEETIDWPRSYQGPEHLHAWLTDRLTEKFLPPEPASRLAESGIAEVARAIAARRAPVAIQAYFSSEDWIVGGWAMLEAFLGYWSGWPDAPPGSPLLVIFALKYRTRPAPRPFLARFLRDRYSVANREAREALRSLSFARYDGLGGVVLDELKGIQFRDLEDWARDKRIRALARSRDLLAGVEVLWRKLSRVAELF
jgi:hypothetical protein